MGFWINFMRFQGKSSVPLLENKFSEKIFLFFFIFRFVVKPMQYSKHWLLELLVQEPKFTNHLVMELLSVLLVFYFYSLLMNLVQIQDVSLHGTEWPRKFIFIICLAWPLLLQFLPWSSCSILHGELKRRKKM